MLTELEICDLGPIRRADIVFPAGMTAITGETGAGKSMLLNALRLVGGGHADASKVSADADQTWVQAIFDVPEGSSAQTAAEDAGIGLDEGQLFLTRQVPAHGRSKAVMNGRTVPSSVLRRACGSLVTIHGQSDQLRLASSSVQRAFLDDYAGDAAEKSAFSEAWENYVSAKEHFDDVRRRQADIRRRADYLRESIAEIEKANPQPHEDDDIRSQRTRAENAAVIADAVHAALAALDSSQARGAQFGGDSDPASVVDLLGHAEEALRKAAEIPELAALAETLNDINAQVSDVVYQLSAEADEDAPSESDLDTLNARLHELSELTRRWGPEIDDVLAWKKSAEEELETTDASPEQIAQLQEAVRTAFAQVQSAAKALHRVRAAAAGTLEKAVNEELGALAMGGAHLTVSIAERDVDSTGGDGIDFLFSAFPGAPLQPLAKSASGGELSRLMLALELSLASRLSQSQSGKGRHRAAAHVSGRRTFVFDEVDSGVGGAAAAELGKRLARLAQSEQVIVVTHLAQVAAWADAQFVVAKGEQEVAGQHAAGRGSADRSSTRKEIATTVTQVTGHARDEEIARMLSGAVSPVSLTHAHELVKSCRLE